MKKTYSKSKKDRRKARENLFFIVLIGVLAVSLVLAIVQKLTQEETVNYVVTQDGHIHLEDGTHIGTLADLAEMEGSGLVMTEEGHIHAEDGTHIASIAAPETDTGTQTEEEAAQEEAAQAE